MKRKLRTATIQRQTLVDVMAFILHCMAYFYLPIIICRHAVQIQRNNITNFNMKGTGFQHRVSQLNLDNINRHSHSKYLNLTGKKMENVLARESNPRRIMLTHTVLQNLSSMPVLALKREVQGFAELEIWGTKVDLDTVSHFLCLYGLWCKGKCTNLK